MAKAKKAKTSYVYFEDLHHEDGDKVVRCTDEEWRKLIAPAEAEKLPLDSGNVDTELFDILYARPAVNLRHSQIKSIERVIPLV